MSAHAAMCIVGKRAVAGFVRGDRQSSACCGRGVLPVCHGEPEGRLPRVRDGPQATKIQIHRLRLRIGLRPDHDAWSIGCGGPHRVTAFVEQVALSALAWVAEIR
jgi:hypothetical protein